MTVCVAAMCDKGRSIITASDMMITINDQTADRSVVKLSSIGHWWTAMIAGDINRCEMIVRRAQLSDPSDMSTAEVVRDRILEAYQHEGDIEAVTNELSGYGIRDMGTFWREGLQNLGSAEFVAAKYRIDQIKTAMGCDLLVFGFDREGDGHLMTFHSPGIVKMHTSPGYAAVGIGSETALNQLAFRGHHARASREETLARVCEAKFRSERTSGVGESTKVYALCCRGEKPYGRVSAFIPEPFVEQAKTIWTSQTVETIPSWSNEFNRYFEPES